MKLLKQLITFTAALLITGLGYAQSAADELAQLLSDMNSLRADFSQQILDNQGRVMQQSSGKFALLRPGRFRWETLQPTQQLLIADGKKIWVYDQDLQQVTVQQQDNRNTSSPAMLLSGSVQTLKRNFNVRYIKKPASEGVWFKLTPIGKHAMFQAVELNFAQDQLQGMRLIDSLGQASVLRFTQVEDNPEISASQFSFKAPKGVDVIDQSVAANNSIDQ